MYFGKNRRWVPLCNARVAASLLKLMVVAEPMSNVAVLRSVVAENFLWDSKPRKYFLQVVAETSGGRPENIISGKAKALALSQVCSVNFILHFSSQ